LFQNTSSISLRNKTFTHILSLKHFISKPRGTKEDIEYIFCRGSFLKLPSEPLVLSVFERRDRSSVADPARKFMGGRLQQYLAVKLQLAAKCLSELYTTMVKKVTFVGFRGGDRPLLDPPLQVISSLS